MRRPVVFAVLAASVFSTLAPSYAVQGRRTLTVAGHRTAYTDITLAHRTVFDLDHASLLGGGRFIGLYIEALDKPAADRDKPGARVGIVKIRDYHPVGEAAPTLTLGATTWLAPGRYRLYLISDGAATIQVPMAGSPGRRLTPRQSAQATAAVGSNILLNPLEASNRQGMQLTSRRSISFSSITIGRFRAFAGQIGACLALPGKDCGSATQSGVDNTYTGWFASPLADREFIFTFGYDAGVLPPGTYDAVQQALNATTMQFAVGAAFTLALH